MYRIKQLPEDFIVKEIFKLGICKDGKYSYFLLTKKNCTTINAVEKIADLLKIKSKDIGFAGNKDKIAVTEQAISIVNLNKNKMEIIKTRKNFYKKFFVSQKLKISVKINSNINLKLIGRGIDPISLGCLEGNEFEIIVRNLNKNQRINKINKILNYFGEQRFSKNNVEVGRNIVKKNFKDAVNLIIKNKNLSKEKIEDYLTKNNYIGALNSMNKKILLLYVHSYQSYIFNEAVKKYLQDKKSNKIKNIKIPIIGFGTEIEKIKNQQLKKIINKILAKEEISPRDFVIREIPGMSSEGGFRDLFARIEKLKIGKLEKDDLNRGKYKVRIKFGLQKGSYATVAVKELFNPV